MPNPTSINLSSMLEAGTDEAFVFVNGNRPWTFELIGKDSAGSASTAAVVFSLASGKAVDYASAEDKLTTVPGGPKFNVPRGTAGKVYFKAASGTPMIYAAAGDTLFGN